MNKDQYTLTQSKYAGKYVALVSFSDRTVIASGKNPDDVFKSAKTKGHKAPFVFFVPPKNSINLY